MKRLNCTVSGGLPPSEILGNLSFPSLLLGGWACVKYIMMLRQSSDETAASRGLVPEPLPATRGVSSEGWIWQNLRPSHACLCLSSPGTLQAWPGWQQRNGEVWGAITTMLTRRVRPDAARVSFYYSLPPPFFSEVPVLRQWGSATLSCTIGCPRMHFPSNKGEYQIWP